MCPQVIKDHKHHGKFVEIRTTLRALAKVEDSRDNAAGNRIVGNLRSETGVFVRSAFVVPDKHGFLFLDNRGGLGLNSAVPNPGTFLFPLLAIVVTIGSRKRAKTAASASA
jgi:hypothetical protein